MAHIKARGINSKILKLTNPVVRRRIFKFRIMVKIPLNVAHAKCEEKHNNSGKTMETL